jgi:c-di-GMP-binding flagellar brake protein YcgR
LNSAMENANPEISNEITTGLTINELLQVQVPDDPNPATYRSRIEDIVDKKLLAAWPTSGGIRLPVHTDQILGFSLVRNGIAYSFNGLVDSTTMDPLPQITIILTSDIQRVQRRQDFRIKCLIPIELTGFVPGSSKDGRPEPIHLKTACCDISASGVAIRNSRMIPDGVLLDVKIGLPDKELQIKVPCRVVHSEVAIDNSKLYHTGMQFLAISEKEKARIVRYVYRTQLKGLRD